LLFVISVIVIPCGLSLHTHTHALHELSGLFEFSISRKIFVLIKISTLFYISA